MSKLIWDQTGKRTYETGVNKGVLYPIQTDGAYSLGVAWNGLTNITESPTGATATPFYADNIKYLNLMSAEEYGATIQAYTYPDEFNACLGIFNIADGVSIGQQNRKMFGLAYRTVVGNDVLGTEYGYKIHLVYGALAAPSEKAYGTINNDPQVIQFSWSITTTPVSIPNFKPTAIIVIDSTITTPDKMSALEDILYGTDGTSPTVARLPLPAEIATLMA